MSSQKSMVSFFDWALSWVLKFKSRKSFWSFATPAGLFLVAGVIPKIEILDRLVEYALQNVTTDWATKLLQFAQLYLKLDFPAWSMVFITFILFVLVYVRILEVKAKKTGLEVTTENFTKVLRETHQGIFHVLSQILDKISPGISAAWIRNQCETSIHDLGNRYTSELNFELEISEVFEGLGRTAEFEKKITQLFDRFLIKGRKIQGRNSDVSSSLNSTRESLDRLYRLFTSIRFQGTESIPVDELLTELDGVDEKVESIHDHYLAEERKIQKEKNEYSYYHKYGYELRNIKDFQYELRQLQDFMQSSTTQLANHPFLLLDGEAGIGKSHLIGDIVSRRIENDYESIFLLGQHFVTREDPWTQIFKILKIDSSSENFLANLNTRAESKEKRIVFLIDALNEGQGKVFWNNFIRGFIAEFRKYKWLGLVLTIRSSYKPLIFPEDEWSDLKLIEHRHFGFMNVEYEASKLFFENYRIELPSVPLMHPEFQSPLFLRLFCEGLSKAGLTKIPGGLQGIVCRQSNSDKIA